MYSFFKIWLSTAFSSGLRVIEFPFIIYFLTRSLIENPGILISDFGVFVSILVGSTGFLLGLSTPVVLGVRYKIIIFYTLISILISFLLLLFGFLIVFSISSLTVNDVSISLLLLMLFSQISIAARRIKHGDLIRRKVPINMAYSAFVRVTVTAFLCLIIPARYVSIETAFSILLLGAIIDTILVYLLPEKASSILNKSSNSKIKKAWKIFLSSGISSSLYLLQGFVVIVALLSLGMEHRLEGWIIVFSFISIYTSLVIDNENIIASSAQDFNTYLGINIGIIVLLLMSLVWVSLEYGSQFYFVNLQGMDPLEFSNSLVYLAIIVAAISVLKQSIKGRVYFLQRMGFISFSALAFVIFVFLGSTIFEKLFDFTNSAIAGCILLLFGIVGEIVVLLLGSYRPYSIQLSKPNRS